MKHITLKDARKLRLVENMDLRLAAQRYIMKGFSNFCCSLNVPKSAYVKDEHVACGQKT